jgi:CubicO group peptidase (beta-lactamase class C family)
MRRLLGCFVVTAVTLAVPQTGTSQALPTASPHSVGISGKRLARVDALFQSYIDQAQVVGVVSAIARHGKLVRLESQGLLDMDEARPMIDDVIFRIASMTKPITSVAVMMLYEEGLFQLEDPASKYIPELAGMKPEDAAPGEPGPRTAQGSERRWGTFLNSVRLPPVFSDGAQRRRARRYEAAGAQDHRAHDHRPSA